MNVLPTKSRTIAAIILAFAEGFTFAAEPARQPILPWPSQLPKFDHVVIVVEENKDYDEIIGNPKADYINSVLKTEGANFTQMFAEEHNSQGNYFWMFSGSNQNVGFHDVVPSAANHPHYPLTASNLGQQLIVAGRSFKGFSENLPAIGNSDISSADGLYARKHVPWISFANIPNGQTADTSCNLRMADFPNDFRQLPTVAFVIPNLINDMHNGDPDKSVHAGDTWLKTHLDSYYQWAKSNNSLLILTFDECNDRKQFCGLTTPQITRPANELQRDIQNRIVTIFAGARIKRGDYAEGKGLTHVNILRTIEAMYGLPKSGCQQPNAASYGITDDDIISDVFE